MLGWLAERSPDAAARLSAQFERALNRLETFPYSCGQAYENMLVSKDVGQVLRG